MFKNIILLIFSFLVISCKNEVAKQKEIATQQINSVQKDTIQKTEKRIYSFDKDFILGKFNYRKDTSFVKAKSIHTTKDLYLNKEVYDAFIKMYNEAKKNNITLKIVSGTRSFYEQQYIWERKWEKYKKLKPIERALKILEYSSMPSTSRHHWGTDIDLINLNNSYFENGKGKKEYDWLVTHANSFGFFQVYTHKDNGRTGYNLEKWHWSYLPLAKHYLTFYNENITYKDIKGFKGASYAKDINIIEKYVNGIAKKAKQESN